MKKRLIYSTDCIFDEDARKEYQEDQREIMEDDTYEVSDEEWYETCVDSLGDERMNLDTEVDGVIIAMARVGTWRGKFNGYKIIGTNVSDILSSDCEYNEWYGDGYNIRSTHHHHDGTNTVIYRVAPDMKSAERIAAKIYNDPDYTEAAFRKDTRSLYPYVAGVYGWKRGRFDKKRKAA